MPHELSAGAALFGDMAQVIWHADGAACDRLTRASDLAPEQTAARLHIHASTTWQTLIGALAEAVPSLAAMLPAQEFASLAQDFIACYPPTRSALHTWGDGLPDFLAARHAPSGMIAMARLDRAWMASFFAAEAEPMTSERLTTMPSEAILRARLTLHPSVQLVCLEDSWFEDWCACDALPQLDQDREKAAAGDRIFVSRPW
jgi:hypothetical protein